MNEVARPGGTAVANPTQNYFTSYGDQVSQRSIVGKLLKFSKGDYLAGEDNDEIPHGTRFIALMDDFLVGWIRWEDNKPTNTIMGRLAEGYQPPQRNTLGDDDKNKWEVDETSKEPRDPWQFSNYLLLKMVDHDHKPLPEEGEENEHVYTFTASSKGGISAMGVMAKKYGMAMAQHPDEWPVIEIGGSSYPHKNKAFGRIKVPVLKIVGWVPKDNFVLDEIADDDDKPAPQQALPLHGGARF